MSGLKSKLDDFDTAIFVVQQGSPLCLELLKMMRSPGMLSARALANFEAGWNVYERDYAKVGGPFGALLYENIKARGPVLAMGMPSEVSLVTEILSRKARDITRRYQSPLFVDPVFETAARNFAAEFSHTEGSA